MRPTLDSKVKRLDRAAILAHYRQHGPRGTFLASTCKVTLASSKKASIVYVMPKYKLSLCWDDKDGMAACMKLALASDGESVRTACNAATGTYDVYTHMRLRQRFTTIYVTDSKEVIDLHRDYTLQGGFSEHSLFIQGLVSKDGFLEPVPKGPENSRPRKRRPKAWRRRSEFFFFES